MDKHSIKDAHPQITSWLNKIKTSQQPKQTTVNTLKSK